MRWGVFEVGVGVEGVRTSGCRGTWCGFGRPGAWCVGWGWGWIERGNGMKRTMSWVTCFGLKPSAAVADRVSDEDEDEEPERLGR